jgi:hypothetical protein
MKNVLIMCMLKVITTCKLKVNRYNSKTYAILSEYPAIWM